MREVFDELYEKYHHDIFTFLLYMVNNREQAEDLVQEVYIRVLKSYDSFKGNSSEKTWLFAIARHVAIDSFRKNQGWKQKILSTFDWNRTQLKDTMPLPEDVALQNEQTKSLYRCLDGCSLDQKMVIILRFIQGFSIAEASTMLGWTESKVKTTQHRALKKLKSMMAEEYGEEGSLDGGHEIAR